MAWSCFRAIKTIDHFVADRRLSYWRNVTPGPGNFHLNSFSSFSIHHTNTNTRTCTNTRTITHAQTHSHPCTHSLFCSHSFLLALTLSLTYTCTSTHTLTLSLLSWSDSRTSTDRKMRWSWCQISPRWKKCWIWKKQLFSKSCLVSFFKKKIDSIHDSCWATAAANLWICEFVLLRFLLQLLKNFTR